MSSDIDKVFDHSSLSRRWVSEANTGGYEEGLRHGIEVGLRQAQAPAHERGKRNGYATALRIVIERRFGPLTNDVRLALVAGDVSTLENATAVAATGTLEDVRAALGL